MALSNELISQFAKLVKEEKKPDNGTIVYGKIIVDADGQKYVQLDGSDFKTPITEDDDLSKTSATTDVKDGDQVVVTIKDHIATVTGNISSPAVRKDDAASKDDIKQIQEFDILIGEKVTANEAYIKQLQTEKADVLELQAAEAKITNLEAKDVEITGTLEAQQAEITNIKTTKIDASVVEANYATIEKLNATDAKVRDLEAYSADIEELKADNVTINNTLDAQQAVIKDLNVNYANIDFSNIKMAAVEELFAKSGIIKDLVVGDTSITGELVGVTLKGDLIEAGTLKADKLVVKGSDGIFYKLNVEAGGISAEEAPQDSLHGSVITAKSITAEKVSVKDLVAFGATIGGFKITDNSIHSVSKPAVDSGTRGVYLDNEGQVAFGDGTQYFKYYKQSDGTYRLEISADSIKMVSSDKTVESMMNDAQTAVDKVTDLEDRANSGEFKGEDATVLRIDSSRGTVFKNNAVSTVLSAVIYRGSKRITDIKTLRTEYGNSAYLEWQWQKLGETTFGTILSTDKRIGNDGFTFTLSPEDVDTKVVFMCQLVTE